MGVNLVVGNLQAARWRGSTEPVLGLRFTGFLMCQASGGEMSLPVTVHDLEMLLERCKESDREENGVPINQCTVKFEIGFKIVREIAHKCMCQNGQDELPRAMGSTRMRARTEFSGRRGSVTRHEVPREIATRSFAQNSDTKFRAH